MFALGNPTESVSHRPDEQVAMTVTDGGAQQQFTTECALIEEVGVHHTVAIEQHAVDTDHQHATLIADEPRHRTIGRLKLL